MPSRSGASLSLLPALVFSLVFPVLARSDTRTPHRVPQVREEIELDGYLKEGVWNEALAMELAWEVRPGENIEPPVRTEILLAYTESHLYVGFRAYDSNPDAILARLSDRDTIFADDWVAVVLDTMNDERRTYDFFSNPLGIQADQIESPEGGGGSWDAIWDSAGRITEWGYAVEMRIPFSSLRFQRSEGDQVWGIDAVRSYPRAVRHQIGLFSRDRNNNCYLCQSEKLIGFAGATPGRNLEIAPTVSSLYSEERDEATGSFVESENTSEPGLTTSWGITPNLTLSGTLNPDFSQVEADVAQLDVNTQFALFFPEKRPFFLEGADFFQTRLRTVHTRTVADPTWGLKLSGKEGKNALGFFVAEDELTNLLLPGSQGSESDTIEDKNLSAVFRYRRDFGRASTFGVIATDREGDEYYNRVLGVDADLKLTSTDRLRIQWLGSQSRYPGWVADEYDQPSDDFDGDAFTLHYLHNTKTLDYYAGYREIEPGFRADLGFMPRVGIREAEAGWGYTWNRDPGHWYTMLNVGSGYELTNDHRGDLLQSWGSFWFNYEGPRRSFVDVWGGAGKEVFEGIEFDTRSVTGFFGLWPTGSLFVRLGASSRKTIDFANVRPGDSFRLLPAVEYRFGRHLRVALNHTFEKMDVEGGRLFEANLSRLRAVYQLTKRSFVRVILQQVDYDFTPELYVEEIDPKFRSLSSQLLFSYKVNPQTALFVGYSDNYEGDHEVALTQTNRAVFFKIGYAWVM